MKKSLYLLATVAIFAACANNDTFKDVDTQNAVIGFGHSATEKSTRAELDMAWFRESDNVGFGVYGFKSDAPIFTNENVVCSDETSPYAWSHTTIRFWDKAAADAYDFYAYAPFTGTNNTAGTNPTFTHTPTSPSTTTGFTFTGLPVIVDITTDGADKAVAAAVEDIDYDDTRLHDVHSNSPTVKFVFNHILSKLSFKIYTPVKPNDYETVAQRVANFTVKSIKIDFPSATSVTWTETAKNAPAGTTTYDTYAAKTGGKADAAFETTVYDGATTGTPVPYGETSEAAVAIGNTYIVTPVNSTVTKHEFDIQVTYDIAYIDGTTETGCKATGTIGTGNPALSPGDTGYDANIYAPGQNQYYVAVIKLDPAKIEFCVEEVNEWNPNGQEVETEVD